MKALLSEATGGPETLVLRDFPDPEPGPGQLLVRVRAAAINYPDVLIIEDKYQFRPPRPFAPGGEIAGIVEKVGEAVSGWSEGDRLIAMIGHGGLAEKVVIDAGRAIPLPAERSFEEGSALILTYATSIHALLDRGWLKAGETLLVLGAAGGVGLAAVELGKAYGARVVAAVSSETRRSSIRAGRLTGRGRRRSPSSSRMRLGRTARTSSTIRSAAIMPSRLYARSPGRGAISSSVFPPAFPAFRST
jgi:NADPH2:quinone reductase